MAEDEYKYLDVGGVWFVKDVPARERAYREVAAEGKWPGSPKNSNRTWRQMIIDVQLATLRHYANAVDSSKDRVVGKAIHLAKRVLGLMRTPPQLSDEGGPLLKGRRLATGAGKIAAHRKRQRTLEDYASFAGAPFEGNVSKWLDDETFGYLRLAGMNPVLVRQEREPDRVLACADRDTLQHALGVIDLATVCDEGRIHVVDREAFAPLARIQTSVDIEHPHRQRFVSRPTAVFLQNAAGHLDPLTIRCSDRPGFRTIPRGAGQLWERAKLHFQVAESLSQTYVTHQPQTHFIMEAVTIATRRVTERLRDHPVARFLAPHLEGTLAVNYTARNTLLTADSPFAEFIGMDSNSANAVMAAEYDSAKSRETFCTLHDLLPPTHLDLCYPFRDDFKLVGACLDAWAKSYVDAMLVDVPNDKWIEQWGRELRTGAHIKGIEVDSPEKLVSVLATIAKIASLQHAALHFPQTDLGRFAALTPFYASDVPPGWGAPGDDELETIASLPDLHAAAWQAFTLSQNRFVWRPLTMLADHEAFENEQRLDVPKATLRNALAAADTEIARRNDNERAGRPPYVYLRPVSVPCSINV